MKIWKDFSGDEGYSLLFWKNGTNRTYSEKITFDPFNNCELIPLKGITSD